MIENYAKTLQQDNVIVSNARKVLLLLSAFFAGWLIGSGMV